MGNTGSSRSNPPPPPPPPPRDPHRHRHPYAGAYDPAAGGAGPRRVGYYPPWPPAASLPPTAQVEHQRAVTVRNDVNIQKGTLRLVPDPHDPSRRLLAFLFNAAAPGSITVYFFAQEDEEDNLKATKESLLKPVTVAFQEGQGQEFRQPCGTGIDVSLFEESELTRIGEAGLFPIAVKAEAAPSSDKGLEGEEEHATRASISQIVLAVFEKKENAEYGIRVVQQILWINGSRFVLQEIYGICNSADGDAAGDDSGKECVVCLSEPKDTTVLPCRHMCLCRECAQILRFRSNKCPICRQPVERLLEIEVDRKSDPQQGDQY